VQADEALAGTAVVVSGALGLPARATPRASRHSVPVKNNLFIILGTP